MRTLERFSHGIESVPAIVSWYLSGLGEFKGKQELFTRQSPQRHKILREHAIIEGAVSSNRIEGVEVDNRRIATIVFGTSILRDRSEEEVRGYRGARPHRRAGREAYGEREDGPHPAPGCLRAEGALAKNREPKELGITELIR